MFAVANPAPTPTADAAIRQSAWWRVIPRPANSRRQRPARCASAARRGVNRSARTRRRADSSSSDRRPLQISSIEMGETHGSTPTRLNSLIRSAAGRPRSASMSTVESRTNRDMSAGPARVSPPLCSDPSSRIFIPLVACVFDAPQGCLEIVPPALVVEASSYQLGDEGAAAPRTCPSVKIGNKFVVQPNV